MDFLAGKDRRIGYALEKIVRNPNMSYVQDATQQYPKEVMKLDELRAKVDPMAFQICSQPMTYAQIQYSPDPIRTDILRTLFELSDRGGRIQFDYIGVMQDYIELLRTREDNIGQFRSLFENLKTLGAPWIQLMGGKKVPDAELIDVAPLISPSVAPFIEYTNNSGGKLGEFFKSVIEKVHDYIARGNYSDKIKAERLYIMCRIFLERVIPILDVLMNLNNTPEGRTFINNLSLGRLIVQMRDIQKQEEQIKYAEQKMKDLKDDKKMLVSGLETKFVPKPAYSEDEQAFVDSGNASQSVIGSSVISRKGGRRTRRHKKHINKKRSGHKRSGHKKRMSRRR